MIHWGRWQCTNLTEGHFAEEYIQQLALHLGDFSKGVAAVEQIKAETEPNEGQYYAHCSALQVPHNVLFLGQHCH